MKRRQFCQLAATTATACMASPLLASDSAAWRPKYLLGSCLYGYAPVADVVAEVRKTGAKAIDIWPKVHGNQREQIDAMGADAFAELLAKHDVQLGCLTQYRLGPFRLQDEMRFAEKFGCKTIVAGGSGPKGLKGSELKRAVGEFAEKMKPHLAVAAETGVTIAIENHANNLIESPDSMKWLIELCPSPHLGIALAPYHLPQDPDALAGLIHELCPRIEVFYAWQHGMGSTTKQARELEMQQMPGRGELDFAPIMHALAEESYSGWTEIFMHSFPRGTAIADTTAAVTADVNRARDYLASL
ncbi:sugar phosphate isomerase/epimerase family protein [Novipirellula caenicola]|uniref:Xylose isomerase-like TIM barrel domain-containing protein n=1 Tax=Novipirellula caenicola TaxID=1536901 RepID=A0ABP9VSP7_9BACT